MTEQELRDWIQLTATPGVGNTAVRRLLTRYGLPSAVLTQSAASLEVCISPAKAAALLSPTTALAQLQSRTWEWLNTSSTQLQHHIITLGDPDYPKRLLEIADPPVLLYVLGHGRWFDTTRSLIAWPDKALAMVGSRNPTAQGTTNGHAFAKALALQGVTVVSGMALGIDTAAHEGALAASTGAAHSPATIAVIGTGIDRVYPRHNHALAQQIAQRGWIVSEYHLGTPPLAGNFPKRNRIIAGLSLGTLVVEAALKSGSLITARMAVEQGKEVLAIPGSIHSPLSRGCHALIRQGAKLVESAEDVSEELRLPGTTSQHRAEPADDLDDPDADTGHGLLAQLGHDPVSIDALSARTGQAAAALQAQLLELELDGLVARLPGGLFLRISTV